MYTADSHRVFRGHDRATDLANARYYARRHYGERGIPAAIQEVKRGEFWVTSLAQARRYGWSGF